jgi:hypothetical protein
MQRARTFILLLTIPLLAGGPGCAPQGTGSVDAAPAAPVEDATPAADAAPGDSARSQEAASLGDSGAKPPLCGNGVVEPGESCDGTAHGGQSCKSLGFDGGQLRCTLACAFDTLLCTRCGNGKVEAGERCDGNCPTSCPASAPCLGWTLVGSSSSCDAECLSYTKPCGGGCPKNSPPSNQLGSQLFTGDFANEQDRITSTGSCTLYGRDAVFAWQAPAAGIYDFSACAMGSFLYGGSKVKRSSCAVTVSVLAGAQCVAGVQVLACKSSPNASVRMTLSAGQQVLVAASFGFDDNCSGGICDLDAPYWISIAQCTPACTGKLCGDDGCGGSCGSCKTGTSCSAGKCSCSPACAGKLCGDDGCGGSCGSCKTGTTCSAGKCSCSPVCAGKSCGDDGCGGSCGSCKTGSWCSAGKCVPSTQVCDPVTNSGCTSPEGCWLLSTEQPVCALTGSGKQGAGCSSTSSCAGGHGCFAGTCRKICELFSGAGCASSQSCTGVSGWTSHGACQ